MKLKPSEKEIIGNVFGMGGGYVLGLSKKKFGDFFHEKFNISIYDKKYDYNSSSKSTSARLKGILQYEDEQTVGKIILELVNYKEAHSRNLTEIELRLLSRAKEICNRLVEVKSNIAKIRTDITSEVKKTDRISDRTFHNRYYSNKQDLVSGTYIDDNSLYLYFIISNGVLCDTDPGLASLFLEPYEWNSYDYLSFILKLADDYDIELTNIHIEMSAVSDDFPDWEEYEYEILEKFSNKTATKEDLKDALIIYEDNKGPSFTQETDNFLSSLLKTCFTYTSFNLCLTEEAKNKMTHDLKNYISLFKQDRLLRFEKPYRIRETQVGTPVNMTTYNFQVKTLLDSLEQQYVNYGEKFTLKNIFTDDFPNIADSEITPTYIRDRYRKKDKLFFHTLISLDHEQIVKIHKITNNWSHHEDEDYTHHCLVTLLPRFFSRLKVGTPSTEVLAHTVLDNERNKVLQDSIHYNSDLSIFYINKKEVSINKDTTIELLLKNLLPLGKEKSVKVAYTETTTVRSKYSKNVNKLNMTDTEMYKILQSRTKDLMSYLKEKGVRTKLSLCLNYDSGTLYLYEKKR